MKQVSAVVSYGPQVIKPVCDRLEIIHRVSKPIGGPLGLFTEAISNSHSPERGNASEIGIKISGRGDSYSVTLLDNGVGMDQKRRQRFLDMAFTDQASTGRNRHGLGVKRLAAEFEHCEVLTRSREEAAGDSNAPMWRLAFKWQQLFDILSGGAGTIEAVPLPPDWSRLGLKPGGTGTVIILSKPTASCQRFTAEKLCKRLAAELTPDVATKVRVNEQELEKRQTVGDPLRAVFKDTRLGQVRVDLYVPRRRTASDELKIGAFSGILEWSKFASQIPAEILLDRLSILSEGVFGTIVIQKLADYETASRDNMDPSLFSNALIEDVVRTLEVEVVPDVERLLGVIKNRDESERDARLKDELQRYISKLGEGGDRIRDLDPLGLNVHFLELLPSQRGTEIRVEKYNPDRRLGWDLANCGGKAEIADDGASLIYTPGAKVGDYSLSCSYKDNAEEKRARVSISIVSQKVLRINPKRVTIEPGRQVELEACNHEDDSSGADNLRWRLDSDDQEGFFLVQTRGKTLQRQEGLGFKTIYQAGHQEGEFTVEVYDKENRRKKASCLIHVHTKVEGTPRPPKGNGGILIGGIHYNVAFDRMTLSPELSRLSIRAEQREVRINLAHPICQHIDNSGRGDSGLVELALFQILHHHAEQELSPNHEPVDPATLRLRVTEVYTSLVVKMEGSEAR